MVITTLQLGLWIWHICCVVNFSHVWRDLQFKVDSEWQIFLGKFEFLPETCWEKVALHRESGGVNSFQWSLHDILLKRKNNTLLHHNNEFANSSLRVIECLIFRGCSLKNIKRNDQGYAEKCSKTPLNAVSVLRGSIGISLNRTLYMCTLYCDYVYYVSFLRLFC